MILARLYFYPRSPCGERLWPGLLARPFFIISIHALLAESDLTIMLYDSSALIFLSTLSLRRATICRIKVCIDNADFYPRSPCGERPPRSRDSSMGRYISIHALLAESDNPIGVFVRVVKNFYPRSPCGERHILVNTFLAIFEFLSTLSLRRATSRKSPLMCIIRHFYPRSPCGERPLEIGKNLADRKNFYPRSPCGERPDTRPPNLSSMSISIHALLAESDLSSYSVKTMSVLFLSTLSLRRATVRVCEFVWGVSISIHALLAESDINGLRHKCANFYFYPRSPCGERLRCIVECLLIEIFLSTLSLRRATHYGWSWYDDFTISIHALLAESDHTGVSTTFPA